MKEVLDASHADVFKASFLPSFIDYNNLSCGYNESTS